MVDWYGTKALAQPDMQPDMQTQEGTRLKIVAFVLAVAIVLLSAGESRSAAEDIAGVVEVGLTERIVVDRVSGIAISGFDPVAYFVAGKPVEGAADHEIIWQGAAWRFANLGNLEAFRADPTVYAPQFGGYDAVAIGSRVAMAGDPRLFAIIGDRLFLFRDRQSREAFITHPASIATSDAAWPDVAKTLIP
jgi:hypothetical protein